MKSHSHAEAQILALLVRQDGISEPERFRALSEDADWQTLVQMAQKNGVSGLISPRITELHSQGLVPDAAAKVIQANAMAVAAASLSMDSELKRLFSLASEHGISLILLKGAAVANLLYPRPHARQAGDIDLLCKEEEFNRFNDALVEAGYSVEGHREPPSKCSTLETAFEQKFRAPSSGILIELHVDSIKLGVRPTSMTSIWDRAIPVAVGDTTVHSLSPQDLAFMLSVHLHRHGFDRLAWFKDIDLLIRQYGDKIDWEAVVDEARREGATASLWITFVALEKMLGTTLPAGLLDSVRPSIIPRFLLRMVWPSKKIYALDSHTRRRAVQFSVGESWRGRLPSMILMGRRRDKLRIMGHRLKLRLKGK